MKEFVPYELALRMKQLGFDEPCLGFYNKEDRPNLGYCTNSFQDDTTLEIKCTAPLYQQAFRWFRDNHNLFHEINVDKTMEPKFAYTIKEYESAQSFEGFKEDVLSEYLYYKHEEAETACLEKLVEIIYQTK